MFHWDLVSDSHPLQNLEHERAARTARRHKENQLVFVWLPHKAPYAEASKKLEPPTWPQGAAGVLEKSKGRDTQHVV